MDTKRLLRTKRHKRLRHTVAGTATRPRLSVYRGLRHIYAQCIDDTTSRTLFGMSDTKVLAKGTGIERATALGTELAKVAKEHKITTIVFDRGGFKYHGQIKAFADALRAGGLQF